MGAPCHCRDCQQANGSAFAANLVVSAKAASLTKAAPTYHEKGADRGQTMSSRLMLKHSASPETSSSSTSQAWTLQAGCGSRWILTPSAPKRGISRTRSASTPQRLDPTEPAPTQA